MRILVLNGSPKKKSDTFRLTDAFLRGINRNNDHEIDVVNVIEKNISPCTGCFGCWTNADGYCVIQDDQNNILDLFRTADLVIWSFPLYCFGMPSHLKAVLDRRIPFLKMKMVEEPDGRVRHERLVDLSAQHNLVICGCGFPDWEGNFESLRLMCKTCFRNLDMICVPETPMLNVPEASGLADRLLERFRKAGEEYDAAHSLKPETIRILETPMIPRDEYIRHVNQI